MTTVHTFSLRECIAHIRKLFSIQSIIFVWALPFSQCMLYLNTTDCLKHYFLSVFYLPNCIHSLLYVTPVWRPSKHTKFSLVSQTCRVFISYRLAFSWHYKHSPEAPKQILHIVNTFPDFAKLLTEVYI